MEKLQVVKELHSDARRRFMRRKFPMRGVNDTIQADLMEMCPFYRVNRGYRYILIVINVFSKKVYGRPMKNKTAKSTVSAMKSILDSMTHSVHNLHVDQGGEFWSKQMAELMKTYKINMYHTYSTTKAFFCERVLRTLKRKLYEYFSFKGSYKWIDKLQKIIDKYNDTKHRTIKMKPNDVSVENQQHLLDTVYNYKRLITHKKSKFKVNDPVRLTKYKHQFEKGYTPNYTCEVFRIKKIQHTHPITYILEDENNQEIKGCVYEEELQHVMFPNVFLIEKILRRKNKKVYVKWLGFDNSFNSWIRESDVLNE